MVAGRCRFHSGCGSHRIGSSTEPTTRRTAPCSVSRLRPASSVSYVRPKVNSYRCALIVVCLVARHPAVADLARVGPGTLGFVCFKREPPKLVCCMPAIIICTHSNQGEAPINSLAGIERLDNTDKITVNRLPDYRRAIVASLR